MILATILATAVAPGPASAQSFFEGLFGIFTSKKPASAPPAVTLPPATRHLPPPSPLGRSAWGGEDENSDGGGARGGSYRTVCVRLCDGYYWPISHTASRRDFRADAKACESSCGEEARLFYQSNSSTDAAALIDASGRRYRDLPNAFVYRKRLIDGCTCKPMPWTEAERMRHRQYATAQAGAEVLAGGAGSSAPASRDAEVVAGGDTPATPPMAESNLAVVDAAPEEAVESPVASDVSPTTRVEVSTSGEHLQSQAGATEPLERAPAPKAVAPTPAPEQSPASRQRQKHRPASARARPASAAGSGGFSLFPSGQSKYVWPGDKPGR